tara:strand:- start:255 stop:437 length:183 start_codon:yes stop_codon:yes gene_type:complete
MRGDPATQPELGMGAKFRKMREGQYYLSPSSQMKLRGLLADPRTSDYDVIALVDEEGEWL